MALDLEAVRRLARSEGLEEIYYNEVSRVVSFRKKEGEIRINVYYTTGTVGTAMLHPRQGHTQLFRRNVTTMEDLRAIFQNPRVHTGSGYHRRHSGQNKSGTGNKSTRDRSASKKRQSLSAVDPNSGTEPVPDEVGSRSKKRRSVDTIHNGTTTNRTEAVPDGTVSSSIVGRRQSVDNSSTTRTVPVPDEETAVQESLALLRAKHQSMKDEIEQAKAILEDIKAKSNAEEKQKEEREQLDRDRLARGKLLETNVADSGFVRWEFNETVTCMACGGNGATIWLYENGAWSWSSDDAMIRSLRKKLDGRQKTLPNPVYVAMGSKDRYYIKFADRQSAWVGSDKMGQDIHKASSKGGIASVAFGEELDSYCVVYKNDQWASHNLPPLLEDLITRRRQSRQDLTCVSLGPAGEYFCAAKNGRQWWGGMTSENQKKVDQHKGRIQFLDFGADHTYLLRYN